MDTAPVPTISAVSEPYWHGLEAGKLRFQRCLECAHAWLPPREECPRCLSAQWEWEASAGRGRIISWVVYRQAVHPAFAERVPYNVAIIELDEGPRLISNVNAKEKELAIEAPVAFTPRREADMAVTSFDLLAQATRVGATIVRPNRKRSVHG